MCGISVIFNPPRGIEVKSLIENMTSLVRHRGPDDEGYVFFTSDGQSLRPQPCAGPDTSLKVLESTFPYAPIHLNCTVHEPVILAMGHRRLSIIDLSPAGHQPMCTSNGRYWIVYNGEIYNYVELREELEKNGIIFQSHSDTEVILAAYALWGKDCLQRFNGMWAFVIFDALENKIFAARDRFGVKPLYYWSSPNGILAFASEIKQFTVLPGWNPKINGQIAFDFLVYGLTDHKAETFFEHVYQLQGGEALEIGGLSGPDKIIVYKWYIPRLQNFKGTLIDASKEFRFLLSDSIRLRLRSDVPIGSCLSGGLDSSSIVCCVNDILRSREREALQKTFSACSHEKQFDESLFINEVVHHCNVEAFRVYPSLRGLFDELDSVTWHQDQPYVSTSIFAQWSVFELAASHGVKVMLDGQGADELIAGYHTFFKIHFASMIKGLDFRKLYVEYKAFRNNGQKFSFYDLYVILYLLFPIKYQNMIDRIIIPKFIPNWINTKKLDLKNLSPPKPLISSKWLVTDFCHLQVCSTSLPALLRFEDRDSMAHSVESRVPFLDYRLAEFLLSLPPEYRIANGTTKQVLRSGMKNIVPVQILERRDKLGFATPEEVWMKDENPTIFRELLTEAVSNSKGIISHSILNMFDDMVQNKKPFNQLFWRVISFGQWMKRFGVQCD